MTCSCHTPVHCILPEPVLRHVAEHGDESRRRLALRTLAIDQTLRTARVETGARQAAAGVRVDTAAAALRRPRPKRVIRDAKNGEDLDAPIVRREGDKASGDEAVDEAFEYFGNTWNFFFKEFGRVSIDDNNMTLDGVVHFGEDYDNAFWNGEQMVFDDGSGQIFTRLTQSLAVCAHELGHGIIQFDGPLVYQSQAGALNEHLADAFGAMVDQYARGETAEDADWLIGREILAEGVSGRALRDMRNPGTAFDDDVLGTDPQPGHMDDYVRTTEDNGGVHINSGIPNRAFCTVAETLGGHSWEHAGRIFYATLGHPRLRANSSFRRYARLTRHVARTLYGANSNEVDAVGAGWDAVGVEL